jgi:uncharacterized RDD family membrane protein YckC
MHDSFEEYRKYADSLGILDLQDILNSIDKEKFPDRFDYVANRYNSLLKENQLDFATGLNVEGAVVSAKYRFLNLVLDSLTIYAAFFVYAVLFTVFKISNYILFWKGMPFSILLHIIYYVIMESYYQQSLGKMITGTKVVSVNGQTPSFSQVIIRTLCRLIPFEAFSFLGESPVGWHDQFSNTRVVKSGYDPRKIK